MNIVATMNAGNIPPDVWVHDMLIGGGRIVGEDLSLFRSYDIFIREVRLSQFA